MDKKKDSRLQEGVAHKKGHHQGIHQGHGNKNPSKECERLAKVLEEGAQLLRARMSVGL